MANNNEFKGEIVVASRIVDYLSSGLYESPAACLKELINNSYDADATRVDVFVKPDADRIIIEDDGCGMDRADFEKNFSKISESYKREDSDTTPLGRPKIGKIGIGFIAANEICDVMEIVSTKEGSTELLQVSIRFDHMRTDATERRRDAGDIAKGDYHGDVKETANHKSHFTQIFLKRIRGEARTILAGERTTDFSSGKTSLYGLSPSSTCELLMEENLKTWNEFNAYSKNMLEIALNVPVNYHEHWLPPSLRSKVKDIEEPTSSLGFSVFIDGTELRKPIVFKPSGKAIVDRFTFEGNHVSAKGYFYAQDSGIKPEELQGVLLRIRKAAVGEYDSSFLGFSSSINPLIQSWISGEIMANDKLEDAMNIDRRTLRIAHSAYVELQRAVHTHISDLLKKVRTDIYGTRSQERKTSQAKSIEKKIIDVADEHIASISPKAAANVKRAWSESATKEVSRKPLLKKFTVNQLYQIVVQVTKELLTHRQFEDFLARLTERLKK